MAGLVQLLENADGEYVRIVTHQSGRLVLDRRRAMASGRIAQRKKRQRHPLLEQRHDDSGTEAIRAQTTLQRVESDRRPLKAPRGSTADHQLAPAPPT